MPYDDAHGLGAGDEARHAKLGNLASDQERTIRADAPTRERDPQRREREPNPGKNDDDDQDRGKRDREGGDGADAKDGDRKPDADDKGGDKTDGDKTDGDKKKGLSPWLKLALVLVLVVAIAGAVFWWWSTKDLVTTDDAYTDGRAVTISPKVSGYVTALEVTDNQRVKAGQVLVRIDQRDYIAARDQAQGALMIARGQLANARSGILVAQKNFPARLASAIAQRDSARATLARTQADLRRQRSVSPAATTQQNIDQANAAMLEAQAALAQAEAQVEIASPVQANIDQADSQQSQIQGQVKQAQAQLDQAELNLGYTVVTAPQDGWVTKRNVERGTYLNAGGSIMTIVSPEVWVTANFKESQLGRMRPGQRVDLSVDAYSGLKLKGHIDSVQLGTGSKFTAFPAENATGNYVKIVQRVPVKILIDEGLDPERPLPLGLSVNPTVYLK